MAKSKTKPARLIVASSEQDADMLYATKFWAPDPFIFLQRNGKRTLVLSDLEIGRGRKQADADEFAQFLKKRRVKSAIVPASFPLGYAKALAKAKIKVRPTNGMFWPERDAKSD